MNDDSLSGLLFILVIVSVQAFVTLAYGAVTNARMGTIREQAENGNEQAKRVDRLVTSDHLTVTYYTVSTLIKFTIAALAVLSVADVIIAENDMLNPTLIRGLVLIGVACVTIVLGDIVPEAVGSTYADDLVYGSATILSAIMVLFSPLVFLLERTSRLLSTLAKSSTLVNTITEEEIMTLIDAGHTGGTIEEGERHMLYSVLQLDQTNVSEMMVPRIDITAVEINQTIEEAGRLFVSSGFSRLPVYSDNLDNIKGLLYAKDLLAQWYSGNTDRNRTIAQLMRPGFFIDEDKSADQLLAELQTNNIHMAIVSDEYGGTAGLVTIEDIIEEIIGDIRDEYDLDEEEEYTQISDDEYMVDAGIDLDDLNNLMDIHLESGDSDTLGGYIYTSLGRVPESGDEINNDRVCIRVKSVEGHRIRQVQVIRKRVQDDEEPDDSSTESATLPDQQESESP